MALLDTLTLTADGRVSLRLKNHRTGQANRFSFIAYGTFGGGTITTQISPDGTTWVDNIKGGSPFTFTADTAENVEINSDEINPTSLGFNLAGATTPSITIKIYDNK